jgi:hypothetical protein
LNLNLTLGLGLGCDLDFYLDFDAMVEVYQQASRSSWLAATLVSQTQPTDLMFVFR